MTSPIEFFQWLGDTPWSVELHESIWVYPLVESVHVLTLCVFLGMTAMLDLRLLGVIMTTTPASQVVKRFLPWMITGFVMMVASGAALFYADPVRTYLNIFFRLKLIFLVVAGLNAALFHRMAARTLPQWDLSLTPPFRARLAGGLSLALWATVVVCGRMIAYHWFDQDAASVAG
jgi:uncharacterized protein DUF6644